MVKVRAIAPPTDIPSQIRDAADAIRTQSARLNSATDKASATIEHVEQFLNEECSLGIQTFVLINETDEFGLFLGYERSGGRYRITLSLTRINGEDMWSKPWSDCSRSQKLDSFSKLPELLQKIAKQTQKLVADTEAQVEQVSDALRILNGK